MPKIYIVNDSGHDFSTASSYGELVRMSRGDIDKYQLTKMIRVFDEFLKNSSSSDYILHSGPAIMNMIACSYFASKHGKLNLLIWRAESDGRDHYVVRRIQFRSNRQEREREGGEYLTGGI